MSLAGRTLMIGERKATALFQENRKPMARQMQQRIQ
jgi:hypothetical protein